MATNEGTVISEAILVNGNLEGDEDVTVRGRLEGTLRLSRSLFVEASGAVKAEVAVRSAVISGSVEGNITATDVVEITREGRVVGDISAPRVVITEGATFRGSIETGEAAAPAERPALARAASRPALRPPPRPERAERPERVERPERAERPAREPRAEPARAESADEGGTVESAPSLAERVAAAVKPPAPPVPVGMGAVKRKVVVRRK